MERTLAALALAVALPAQSADMAPPPELFTAPTPMVAAKGAPAIDPHDRAAVVDLYNEYFELLDELPSHWDGDPATCTPGTTDNAFRDAVVDRINVYRALAGLPGLLTQHGLDETGMSQEAALMMAANGDISHTPPDGWSCYSEGGAAGALNSNLIVGVSGTAAVDAFMDDAGSDNYFVGHRRWLLYPPQQFIGVGDVGGDTQASALWVLSGFGERPATPNGVAWPPAGFVPYQMLPDGSNRWSISYPGADFSEALVTVTREDGTSLPVSIEPINNGGFGDATLVFRPQGFDYGPPARDTRYDVSITGVAGNGVPAQFQYSVTVIDPAAEPAPEPPTGTVVFDCGFE